VHQTVSKSFAYIVILAIIIVAIFIVTLDVLKYFFGIDPVGPVRKELQSKNGKKRLKKHKHATIIRYIYVNALPRTSPQIMISTMEETSF
jgi:hypothetical protein